MKVGISFQKTIFLFTFTFPYTTIDCIFCTFLIFYITKAKFHRAAVARVITTWEPPEQGPDHVDGVEGRKEAEEAPVS